MKTITITDDYYKVKWEVSKNTKIVMYALMVIFNAAELFITLTCVNQFSAFLSMVFFDVLVFGTYYFGHRIPCVKWDVNWKKPEEHIDITAKQEKYRTIMNVVLVGIMIWGIVQTISAGTVIIVD